MDALRALIEQSLRTSTHREAYSATEVQDLLLDLLVLVSNAQLVPIG